MNKIRRMIVLSMALLLISSNISFAQTYNDSRFTQVPSVNYNGRAINPYQADIQTQRVESGKRIKLRMETPINTVNSRKGESFIATIIEDIKADKSNNIILPSGTTIRGRIGRIVPNTRLSRGAEMGIVFDHLTTPVGRQIALVAKVAQANKYKIINSGDISAGGGYLNAVQRNADYGTDITIKTTNYGVKSGLAMGNSFKKSNQTQSFWSKAGVATVSAIPVIVLTPITAATGFVAGSTMFFSKSVIDLFRKGAIVKIEPGDVFEVVLVDPLDIPLN